MAQIPLVHGGSQPVFAIDTLNGPQLSSTGTYTPAGTPVMIQGPKLDFFGIDLGADPSGQAGVNGAIQLILMAVQQTSTIAFYQVDATTNKNNLSIALFPTGAYSASTLQATIAGLGTVNGYDVSGAAVTNVGFRLASTATSAS